MRKFGGNSRDVVGRICIRIDRRNINDVQKQSRALQVLEKLDTEPGAVGSAFDQPGNVCHYEALELSDPNDPEVRVQGCKRVVRDPRLRLRHRRDQCGLARIRHAQKSNVCQDLEFESQVPALAGRPIGGFPRRTVSAALEARIAEPTATALGHHLSLPRLRQVGNQFASVDVVHHRPARYLHVQVLP